MRLGRMLVLVGVFYAALCGAVDWSSGVRADETSPVNAIKSVINYLEPTAEVGVFIKLTDLGKGRFSQAENFAGISGSLYKFESHDIELGSIRLGGQFEGSAKLYNTLGINGIGLAKRYLPESVKATLSPGFMPKVWDVLDKHGNVAAGIGLDDVEDIFADGYRLRDHAGVTLTMGIKGSF